MLSYIHHRLTDVLGEVEQAILRITLFKHVIMCNTGFCCFLAVIRVMDIGFPA